MATNNDTELDLLNNETPSLLTPATPIQPLPTPTTPVPSSENTQQPQ